VKCDEAKPHCQRCIKFGVVCDGYAVSVKTARKPERLQKIQTKPLLPKHTPLQALPISRLNAGVGFEDELNGRCFRIYIEETARQINGPFPNPLWATLIPQISEREPFVRHAIIAIGALGKFQLQRQVSGTGLDLGDYQYALKLYERSLRGMREAIAGGKHDLRNALVACLLVFIFEGMLGNQAAAVVHAESGLNLLFDSAIGTNPGKSWRGQKANAHLHFEADLLEAFSALDLQVLLFVDRRSKATHEKMKIFQSYIIGTLPAEFHSLDQARHFWQLIINRNYHFLKSLQSLDIEILQEERLEMEEGSSVNMEANELLLSDPKDAPMTQKEEHLRYRIDIGRWTCTWFLEFQACSASLF
jgi:Fungal Zn(2)-Cys(6) binuclear cluster domain/Fungal specific transcription factor domain